MAEFRVWPSVIRLEVGFSNVDSGGIIGRSGRIDCSVDGCFQARIIESVILSVASYADVRFGACEIAQVV